MKTYFKKGYYLPVCKYRGKIEDIKYPCYASLKLDGEMQYIIKKGNTIKSVNKPKYGRYRESYPALDEFRKLELDDGIYLGELYWNEGRTKEDFYGLLSHKASDELKIGLWGILETSKKKEFTAEETFSFLSKLKSKTTKFKYLSIVPFWKIENSDELALLVNMILSEGWEGIVIRNPKSVYRDGTTNSWIKIKEKNRDIEAKASEEISGQNNLIKRLIYLVGRELTDNEIDSITNLERNEILKIGNYKVALKRGRMKTYLITRFK